MKWTFVIVVLSIVGSMGCKSQPKATKDNSYTITSIRPEKDGETLFLVDAQGQPATMVISIPNGNYVEVQEGDKITVEVTEVMESYPVQLIGKNIKIVERKESVPSPTNEMGFVKGELLVGFHSGKTYKEGISKLESVEGVTLIGMLMESEGAWIGHFRVPVGREKEMIKIFKSYEEVNYAELNGIATIGR